MRRFVTFKYDNNWYVSWIHLLTRLKKGKFSFTQLVPAIPTSIPKLSEQALLPSSDVLTLVDPSIHKRGRVYYLTDKK